jgi:para-nitrobenzyl esterase
LRIWRGSWPGEISFPHYDSGVPGVAELPALVQTEAGDLRGTVENGVAVWRGVPYVRQPVGSMVAKDRRDPPVRDEARLTVTVWSPDVCGSLPVMVWIPGGAFLNGVGQLQIYNGSRLAANGDVVVVNITYRVGVFGGFELGDLGDGFYDNLCLRDQIAALAWVRDNIAAFGGDAGRLTVFGESAAATAVLALMASPAAKGLFTRAIAQSPALPLIADRATRAEQSRVSLRRLGVSARQAHLLKELPQRELRRAAGELQRESVASTPTPTTDNYFAQVAPNSRARMLQAYPGYPRRRARDAIAADVMFVAPTWAFADAYSAHAPTDVYLFDRTSLNLMATGLGAVHGSEIVHVLHRDNSYVGRRLHPLGAWLTPAVGRRIQQTWLDFATAHVPNERLWSNDWPRYEIQRRATRLIRSVADSVSNDPDATRHSGWCGIL